MGWSGTRGEFLRLAGTAVGGAVLAGCGLAPAKEPEVMRAPAARTPIPQEANSEIGGLPASSLPVPQDCWYEKPGVTYRPFALDERVIYPGDRAAWVEPVDANTVIDPFLMSQALGFARERGNRTPFYLLTQGRGVEISDGRRTLEEKASARAAVMPLRQPCPGKLDVAVLSSSQGPLTEAAQRVKGHPVIPVPEEVLYPISPDKLPPSIKVPEVWVDLLFPPETQNARTPVEEARGTLINIFGYEARVVPEDVIRELAFIGLTIIIFKGVDIVLVKVGRALGTVLEMTGTRLLSGARFLKGERGLGEVATAMRGVTLNANEASRKAAIENAVRTGKAVRQAITRNETTMTVINRDGILIFGNGNRVTIGTSEALAMPAHPTPLWFAEGSSSRMAMLAPRSVTAEQTVYDILPMARRAAASDWAEAPVWLDMGAMNSSRARGETLTRIARTPRADSIRATGTPPHKSAAESEAVTFAANMGRPNGAAARAYDTVYDPVAGEVIDLAAKVGPAVASKHAVPIKEVFGNAGDYIPAKSPALPAATRS